MKFLNVKKEAIPHVSNRECHAVCKKTTLRKLPSPQSALLGPVPLLVNFFGE